MPVLRDSFRPTSATQPHGHSAPASSGRVNMSSAKLRVLALHSFRTSAEIFKEQMRRSGLDQKLADLVEFVYVDAPHEATGPAPADVTPFFGPPYREWWAAREDKDKGGYVYEGIEHTLAYIANVLQGEKGPFDGCWAFSQGTLVATVVMALQRQQKLYQDLPLLQFAVLFGGFFHRQRSVQIPTAGEALPEGFQLPVPSVHVIGDRDFIKARSLDLMSLYQDPILLSHPRGHAIPALDDEKLATLITFLEEQLAGKQSRQPQAVPQSQEPPDQSRL